MNTLTERTSISTVMAAFTATGSKPPKPVAAAHDHLATVLDRFAKIPAPDPEGLALAVLAALVAGTDPAASPAVQAIIAAEALAARHPLEGQVRAVVTEQMRTACRDHADAIVAAWRPAFDRAATELGGAFEVLGGVALDQTEQIIRRGPEATSAWSSAVRCIDTLGTITAAWSSLVSFTVGAAPSVRMLTVATVAPEVWIDLDLDHAKADPWRAIAIGMTLRLPTIDGYRQDLAEIEAERRHLAEQEAARQRDAFAGHRTVAPVTA